MDAEELYRNYREKGRGIGHAQWCVGLCFLNGEGVEKDPEKAEEWFLKAWHHQFPGTASTQAFILKRQWDKFVAGACSETPRMSALLSGAIVSSEERQGTIRIPVQNDAQKEWIDTRIEEMKAVFQQFINERFSSVIISAEVQ